jgi:hypothetical protein
VSSVVTSYGFYDLFFSKVNRARARGAANRWVGGLRGWKCFYRFYTRNTRRYEIVQVVR